MCGLLNVNLRDRATICWYFTLAESEAFVFIYVYCLISSKSAIGEAVDKAIATATPTAIFDKKLDVAIGLLLRLVFVFASFWYYKFRANSRI